MGDSIEPERLRRFRYRPACSRHLLRQRRRVRPVHKQAKCRRYSLSKQRNLLPEWTRLPDAVAGYRRSTAFPTSEALASSKRRWVRQPLRGPTRILLHHGGETPRNVLQASVAYRHRAGRAQLPASSFVWTLPSVPAVFGCNPSVEISAHGGAESAGQLPAQRERRRNRGSLDKGAAPVPGAFHQHPDEDEMLSGWLLPPWPIAPEYGR